MKKQMDKNELSEIVKYFEEYKTNNDGTKYYHQLEDFNIIITNDNEVHQLNSDHEIQGVELKTLNEFKVRFKSFTGENLILPPPKTPMEEREWNYYFDEGEEVMFAPDLPDSYFDSVSYYLEHTLLDLSKFKDYRGKKGIVTKCWSDLHAFGRGSSYMCVVKFDGLTHSTMCQFLVKYDEND
jgi:hypothetical protein